MQLITETSRLCKVYIKDRDAEGSDAVARGEEGYLIMAWPFPFLMSVWDWWMWLPCVDAGQNLHAEEGHLIYDEAAQAFLQVLKNSIVIHKLACPKTSPQAS